MFYPLVGDAGVELIGVEAGGRSSRAGDHAATLCFGRPGVLHGSFSYVLQDDDGQTADVHSISAGLDYPGTGPEHSYWKETGRVRYTSRRGRRGVGGLRRLGAERGHFARLGEFARLGRGDEARRAAECGGGDSRLPVRPRRQGRGGDRPAARGGVLAAPQLIRMTGPLTVLVGKQKMRNQIGIAAIASLLATCILLGCGGPAKPKGRAVDASRIYPYIVPESYLAYQPTDTPGLSRPLGHGIHVVLAEDHAGLVANLTGEDLASLRLVQARPMPRHLVTLRHW